MAYRGGYGAVANGRSQYGSAASDIEPRFNRVSTPVDEQQYVSVGHTWLIFELYSFSSFFVMDTPQVDFDFEISENGGIDYASVYAVGSPYTIDIKFKDGQTAWIKIVKIIWEWAGGAKIVIRTTLYDEFDQPITKVTPLRWDDPGSFPYGPGVP